jgi:hypothetical protein
MIKDSYPTLITNYKQRVTTLSKRKRSLIKKAIELSVMCDLDIFMVIFDKKKQKFFELNSSAQFDIKVVNEILSEITRQQFISSKYTNNDHYKFCLDKGKIDSDDDNQTVAFDA